MLGPEPNVKLLYREALHRSQPSSVPSGIPADIASKVGSGARVSLIPSLKTVAPFMRSTVLPVGSATLLAIRGKRIPACQSAFVRRRATIASFPRQLCCEPLDLAQARAQ